MMVKELMSSSVCFVKSSAPVLDAAELMKKYNIGLVPVCDSQGHLLGVVTDRDLVLRAMCTSGEDSSLQTVSSVMTENTVSVTSDMNIHDAACIFSKKGVRRLPVLENDRLVGILSLSDLAKKRIFLAEVGDIMGAMAKAPVRKTT